MILGLRNFGPGPIKGGRYSLWTEKLKNLSEGA